MNVFIWVIVPYLCLAVFVVGHVWRYRYDKFGWTTRSSQLYEDRLLRLGSPLFHFGMLGVVGGHVIGLLVPRPWTEAVGIDDHLYHYAAVGGGLVAGVMALVGMVILIYRRRTVGPVFSATTVMDKVMYAFLAAAIVLGMWNTIAGSIFSLGGEYNYREGVSVWFRSFLAFQPDADLMAEAPIGFQLHALVAFALFALWPFTRLVHVFSATTVMDKVMYAFLGAAIVLGMWNTIAGSIFSLGGEYNYREGVSVWFRSFLAFQPEAELMAQAPIGFKLHALVAFGLFALWPFTRLVHVFSAPVGYLTRPYIVYRSRDKVGAGR